MLADIQETFKSLGKKYGKLLQHLNSLSDDVLYFKAQADKWSIVEVIEHLVVVEENWDSTLSRHIHKLFKFFIITLYHIIPGKSPHCVG